MPHPTARKPWSHRGTRLLLLLISVVSAISSFWMPVSTSETNAQQGETRDRARRALDLPAGFRGQDPEEEDESESIVFYGQEFEADGFFWCLDTSGSMAEGGKLEILKQEVTQAINSLSRRAEFGLVSFNSSTQVWSQQPVAATADRKAAGSAWVQSLVAAGWTCLAPAAVQTLQISNQCRRASKTVLVVGDGVPICNGVDTRDACLLAVATANWQRTPVNTLYVANDNDGQAFMRALAEQNGGQFVHVGG